MKKIGSRRNWLKKTAVLSTGLCLGTYDTLKAKSIYVNKNSKPKALVAGAGIMGCWTAYFLHQKGFEVSICDPFGAGNPRASSGGETRLIRHMYGEDTLYFDMAKRSMELWRNTGKTLGKALYKNTGLLIFSEKETYEYAEKSRALYKQAGLQLEKISIEALSETYPFIASNDLDHAILDTQAGYLLAADSCNTIVDHLLSKGVKWVASAAKPGDYKKGELQSVVLSDGSIVKADRYIFANGPWMAETFPDLLKGKLRVTRQPVFFFGGPAGFAAKLDKPFPVWMNRDAENKERCYGVFDTYKNSFKLAYTQLNETIIDPTSSSRTTTAQEVEHARYLMEKRFPFMREAPLLYTKVCQHTDTLDKHFILGKHSEVENLWLLGGGSGHAFKHGPALGEQMANAVEGSSIPEPRFSVYRLGRIEKFSKKHK